jgi:hypothetical protein
MANDNTVLGKASLWSALIGIVLPASLAVLVAVFLKPHLGNDPGPAYGICCLLFVILELVAFGCGIAARHLATGKAALVISGILLLLVLFVVVLKFWPGHAEPGAG